MRTAPTQESFAFTDTGPGGGADYAAMKRPPIPPYAAVLRELAAVQESLAHLRHLETLLLRVLHEAGITDEEIGTVQEISSQAVGQKRKRRVPNGR